MVEHACNPSGRQRQVCGTFWLAILAYLVSSRPLRDSASKHKVDSLKNNI